MDRKWKDGKGREYDIPEGVDVRKWKDGSETVSIRFRYKGNQCRELRLPASAENIKNAAAMLVTNQAAMQLGKFDYATAFPTSKKARIHSSAITSKFTVKEWCDKWLADRQKKVGKQNAVIKDSTADTYKHTLKPWIDSLGKRIVSTLADRDIIDVAKTLGPCRNSAKAQMMPFRMAMSSAKAKGEISVNPFIGVELKEIFRDLPKSGYKIIPFEDAERVKLYDATKRIYPSAAEMVPFWLWTGLRNEEIFALDWDKHIDWERGLVRVRQVLNRLGQIIDSAKTESGIRDVPLPTPALEALKRQKAFTFVRRSDQPRYIFVNPTTGMRWRTANYPSVYFWPRICREAEVSYRNIYQLRHTYATTMLDRGEDARNVARWLGHKDVTMLFQIYGRERVLTGNRANEFKNNDWKEAV